MSATKTTLIAALALVLTFACGFLAGIAVHRVLWRERGFPPPFPPHVVLNHLDRRLDLTDAQRKQIEVILERGHQRMEAIFADARPRVRQEIDATNAEIERVLTPQQREKFAKMRMRLGGPPEHR